MKDLISKFISSVHIYLLLYGLYVGWTMYDEHLVQIEEIASRSASIDGEIAVADKKVKEIEDFVKKTDEYKARVNAVAKNIETVQKQLPAETNDTNILSYFQSEIASLNIKDAEFKLGKEETSTYFIAKEYSLKAKGTFLQFLVFFERIGNADRIYNIRNLKLSAINDQQKGRFQLITGEGVIQAFRFNPDFKVEGSL